MAATSRQQRPLALDLAIWVAIFVVFLGVFAGTYTPGLTILRGILNTALLAALFYIKAWLLQHWARPLVQWRYWGAALLLFLFFTLCRGLLNDHIADGGLLPILRVQGANTWLWGSALSNFGILALSYLFYLNGQRRAAERAQLTLISERRQAELLQLRSQINPHFLFNVLNNVYALAIVGSAKTAPTVLQLSQLLRYVTYQSQREEVPLEEEVNQLRRYIALFQLRGAQPLDILLAVKGNDHSGLIEPLLLLPLLENAFKHGDFIANPNAYAHFSLEVNGPSLTFSGTNSFTPQDEQKDQVGGVGLDNIRQRLALTYGEQAQLTTRTDNAATTFTFHLSIQR